MHLLCCSNNFWKAPWKSSCVSMSMTIVTASFISLIVRNCLDAHLGQIVCNKNGVVDWGHCPGGNATGPIWRVLASSDGISPWTPLKPQYSNLNPNLNPNPNALANRLWCIDFLTPPTPLIMPYRLPAFLESLMPLKNWCSIHARYSKSSLKHSIRFCSIFSKFKAEFYCISFF